jgi:hypothetical protein
MEINGREPSSPSRWGLGETLALAMGKARRGSPRGVEGGWGCGRVAAVSSKSPSRLKLAGRGARGFAWPCSSAVVLGFCRRWRHPCAAREEMRCGVSFRSSRGRHGCRESRGRWSMSTETFSVYHCFGDIPRAQHPREWMGFLGGVLWVERRGAGGRMASRGRFWPIQSVLYPGGGLGARGFDHHGLGSWAVLSGWRYELRAGVCSAGSVVERWSQKRAGFSARAWLVELSLVALVGFGSRGLAQGEGLTMPCRNGRGTARSRSPSAGNTGLALGALGVQETVPEQGDRAAFASARSWGGVGSWSGGSGTSIGEAGRPGVLPTPLARPGARQPALVTARMEGKVGYRGLC